MLILLRKIRLRHQSQIDQNDVEYQAERLRVGSGQGQDLQLFGDEVGRAHCTLEPSSEGGLRVRCHGQHQVTVADQDVAQVDLPANEWLRIGPHQLARIEAPPGFDLAIEVRIDSTATESVKERLGDALSLRMPRIRMLSYALLAAVLILGFALPLSSTFSEGWRNTLSRVGAPTNRHWATGELSRAHRMPAIAENCSACHEKPFRRVRNQACLSCHTGMSHHTDDPDLLALTGLDEQRCASCHIEHESPRRALIAEHVGLCVDCHARPERFAAMTELAPVRDFERAHPEFRPQVFDRDGTLQRIAQSETPRTYSGLIFPHDVHLDADVVHGPDGAGAALTCAGCHEPERDRVGFRPLSFERHCRGCHDLDAVLGDAVVELPHGDLDAARSLLEQAAADMPAPDVEAPARRRPGFEAPRGEQDQVEAVVDRVIGVQVCARCHEVTRTPGEVASLSAPRWPQRRFSRALFSHASHQWTSCESCHNVSDSADASELLMPDIADCRSCHTGANARTGVASTCVDCHQFHRGHTATFGAVPMPDHPLMSAGD